MKSKSWLNLIPVVAILAVGFPVYQRWQQSQAPSQLDYENAEAAVSSSQPNRDIQEQNDPPLLQRSVDYQLRCETGTLLTDALTYREVSRAVRAKQAARVSYLGNRALKVEAKEVKQ